MNAENSQKEISMKNLKLLFTAFLCVVLTFNLNWLEYKDLSITAHPNSEIQIGVGRHSVHKEQPNELNKFHKLLNELERLYHGYFYEDGGGEVPDELLDLELATDKTSSGSEKNCQGVSEFNKCVNRREVYHQETYFTV